MLSSIKLLILGLATLNLAAPVAQPQKSVDVYKRAGGVITDVICGTGELEVRYTAAEVEKAVNALGAWMNRSNDDKPRSNNGRRIYPHKFKADTGSSLDVVNQLEQSPNSKNKIKNTTWLEFPLMHNKYKGGDPEYDRVIAIVYGQKSGDYYGVHFSMAATHRGADEWNDLVPCRPA